MTRRDKCFTVGSRCLRLTQVQSSVAWRSLGEEMERMGDMDMPKFKHLLKAIQRGYVRGSRSPL